MAHLRIDHLSLEFGGVRALGDVCIDVGGQEGQHGGICGLIGPNGAGKTSLLNCISGFYRPTHGDVTLDGDSLLRVRRHGLAGRGIARTFQNLALFPEMSVFDNVAVGASRAGVAVGASRAGVAVGASRAGKASRADVWTMLARFDLVRHAEHKAQGLPFGTLKRVELARALMARPRLLLLDEPAGGLSHSEVDTLGDLIRDVVAEFAPTVLLVEHHMGLILSVCERIVVLDSGVVIADGPTDEVRDDPAVIAAYLGSGAYLGGGADLAAP